MLLIKLTSYTKKRHENNMNLEKNNKNVSHPQKQKKKQQEKDSTNYIVN